VSIWAKTEYREIEPSAGCDRLVELAGRRDKIARCGRQGMELISRETNPMQECIPQPSSQTYLIVGRDPHILI
jgi:hypothetical protein